MLKKIDKAAQFVENHLELFQCPVCHSSLEKVCDYSVYCKEKHQFDFSKKGTLYFLQQASKNDYDKEMLSARFEIAQKGLFNGILDVLSSHLSSLTEGNAVLDVGCGEGSQLAYLIDQGLKSQAVGFDISKDGIMLAASHFEQAFWCVADLAKSPFGNQAYDAILNVFSPSNYSEFKRLLKPNGRVYKVVPNEGYLRELREIFYQNQEKKQHYSNEQVVEKFKEHFTQVEVEDISYRFKLSSVDVENLAKMTPLGWGIDMTVEIGEALKSLDFITISVTLLVGSDYI